VKKGPRPVDENMSARQLLDLIVEEWRWETDAMGRPWRVMGQEGWPSNAVAGVVLMAPDGRQYAINVVERRT
jgi:hypothetical protein